MNYKVKVYTLVLVLLACIEGKATDSTEYTEKPFNIQIQYAGNLGLISVGAGKNYLRNALNLHFIYGYLPKAMNGSSVHTLAVKAAYTLGTTNLGSGLTLEYYPGLAVLYGITRNTYTRYPNYFPEGYYNSNAFHLSLFSGIRCTVHPANPNIPKISFFTELCTIENQIWSALHTKYIGFFDIWNISFGIIFNLGTRE
ncbi:MAG: hypothetical protein PVF73_00205 [Bacteroidales bacterium]|jgi:hypothetical protein